MWKNLDYFIENFRFNYFNTRSGDRYEPSYQRLTLTFNQSIMRQAPINWVNIPDAIKNTPSLNSFKRKYKRHLLSLYQVENPRFFLFCYLLIFFLNDQSLYKMLVKIVLYKYIIIIFKCNHFSTS